MPHVRASLFTFFLPLFFFFFFLSERWLLTRYQHTMGTQVSPCPVRLCVHGQERVQASMSPWPHVTFVSP